MSQPSGAEIEVQFRTTAEGGRVGPVLLSGGTYRPHLVVAGGEYLGVEFTQSSTESVSPGGGAKATVAFIYEPKVNYAALIEGAVFSVMEGARIVASGRVLHLVGEVRRVQQMCSNPSFKRTPDGAA